MMLERRQDSERLQDRAQRRARSKVYREAGGDTWQEWQDSGEPIGDVLPADTVELMAGFRATVQRQGYLVGRQVA